MDTNKFTRDDTKTRKLETTLQEPEHSGISKTIQFYDFVNLSKENCLKYMLSSRSQFSKKIYNLSE